MNKQIPGLLIGLLLGAAGAWFAVKNAEHGEHGEHAHGEAEAKGSGPVKLSHAADGAAQLEVDAATRARIGLATASVTPTNLPNELRAVGRVLDAAPLHQQWLDLRAAATALELSRAEHARVKSLFDQDRNASARALDAATLGVRRDEATLDSAQARLLGMWGPALSQRKDLEALVAGVASQRAMLVRLDLAVGAELAGTPASASIAGLAGDSERHPVEVLGTAPSVDVLSQGKGYLALLRTNAFAPGATVFGWLAGSGGDVPGVIVPRAAIVRHAGEAFVYSETDGTNTFERRRITLERALPDGFFVRDDLPPNRRVVVAGAQLLLSEELKGEGGQGGEE